MSNVNTALCFCREVSVVIRRRGRRRVAFGLNQRWTRGCCFLLFRNLWYARIVYTIPNIFGHHFLLYSKKLKICPFPSRPSPSRPDPAGYTGSFLSVCRGRKGKFRGNLFPFLYPITRYIICRLLLHEKGISPPTSRWSKIMPATNM